MKINIEINTENKQDLDNLMVFLNNKKEEVADDNFFDNFSLDEKELPILIPEDMNLKEEIKILSERIEVLQKERDDYKSKLEETVNSSPKEDFSAQLLEKDEQLKSISDENTSLKAKIDTLEQKKKTLAASEDKMNTLYKNIEKLNKEIEFHKERSTKNWDDLKVCRNEIKELKAERDSLLLQIKNAEQSGTDTSEMEENLKKLKSDLISQKNEFESKINNLKVTKDKLENQINSLQGEYKKSKEELERLNNIKKIICSNEKGTSLWKAVESRVQK